MSEAPVTPIAEEVQTIETGKQTSFKGDVLKLMSGTTIAQIIGLLASSLIARLYSPSAFGVVAVLSSIIIIIVAVYTLKFDLAIILPKHDSDAANILAGTLAITILFVLLTTLIIWIIGPKITIWFKAPELLPYLWLIPLIVLFGGIGAGHPALDAWASRTRHFTQVSATRVTVGLVSSTSKIIAGFAGFNSVEGLMGGNLLGAMIGPLLLSWHIWRQNQHLFLESVRLPRIWENLKRYRRFAIFNAPSALLNNISWQVPSLLLSTFFSPEIVGYYAFGNQLLRLPMNLIGASIAQAFYSHATIANQDGRLAEFVESTFRRLTEYSFFPLLMLSMIGKELVSLIFGSQWAEAGVYTQILSLWMVFWFISSPMSQLYSVLEKNELSFLLNIVILITRVVSIWLGSMMGSPRLALTFFSVSGAVVYGYLSLSIIFLAKVSLRKIGRILFQNLTLFSIAGGWIILLKLIHVSDWLLVVAAALLVAGYFVYRFKEEIYLRLALEKKNRRAV